MLECDTPHIIWDEGLFHIFSLHEAYATIISDSKISELTWSERKIGISESREESEELWPSILEYSIEKCFIEYWIRGVYELREDDTIHLIGTDEPDEFSESLLFFWIFREYCMYFEIFIYLFYGLGYLPIPVFSRYR